MNDGFKIQHHLAYTDEDYIVCIRRKGYIENNWSCSFERFFTKWHFCLICDLVPYVMPPQIKVYVRVVDDITEHYCSRSGFSGTCTKVMSAAAAENLIEQFAFQFPTSFRNILLAEVGITSNELENMHECSRWRFVSICYIRWCMIASGFTAVTFTSGVC